MAKVDITGLLTGLAGTPDLEREGIKRASAIQGQGVGSNLARSLALQAPQREQMMRQGAGGLFGVDTRTAGQQVQEQLGQLDTSTPEGQKQAVQLIAQVDPTRALALRTRFAEENKALQTATAAALVEEKRYQEKFGLEKRKVEADELKAETAAKAKVYEPKINVDSDGRITVISTDPATAGSIIKRASTRSAAAVEAEKEIERQEKLRQSQQLVIKRNTLVGQAADIRLALEEAEAAKILPLATGFAIQKENPTYATLVGGQTYQKLVDAVSAVQSAQALNSLAELKQQSSTGASGLGATNAMEFSALQSNIRKLNPDVPSTIEAGLQAIERNLDNIVRIDQGLEPIIDWSDPAYAHMVKEKQDGSRAYSYDGKTWYNITEPVGE